MRVRCAHCRASYDTMGVHVIARYADCSVWRSPCCDRVVDDRMFKSLPDIQPEREPVVIDWDGRPVRRIP